MAESNSNVFKYEYIRGKTRKNTVKNCCKFIKKNAQIWLFHMQKGENQAKIPLAKRVRFLL